MKGTTMTNANAGRDPAAATTTTAAAGTKTVYFIRHAESLENLKHQSIQRVMADIKSASFPDTDDVVSVVELLDIASHVDTPLSATGKQQIQDVAQQLQDADFMQQAQIELVVHSPLQRAQETAEGLLQCRADRADFSTAAPTVKRVVQLDALRERTPDECFIPWRKLSYTARRQAFLDWLVQQPEKVVAVVGHSEYFRSLLNLPFKFGHCDVWRAEYRPHSRTKWFGLERLYRHHLNNKKALHECSNKKTLGECSSSLTNA
eukprot:scaffold1162_cov170-Amphora_coffeaeformis.AAC.5